MIKRRRFHQTLTLEDRLAQETEQLHRQAENLKPGVALDEVVGRIRQNEAASSMSASLRSPGLRAPT